MGTFSKADSAVHLEAVHSVGVNPTVPSGALRSDAARNREAILAAARRLFAKHGFDVSMDAVAKEAGVGRGTLYRNFEDIHALSWAIFDENIKSLESAAEQQRGKAGAFERLLQLAIDESLDSFGLIPALGANRTSPHLNDLVKRTIRLLTPALEEGQRRKELRADLKPAHLLEILGMVFSAAISGTTPRSRRDGAKRALDLLLNGVRPR